MQGVGFRPFIYRLAAEFKQKGWVANTAEGVKLAIEGSPRLQQLLLEDMSTRLPPFAGIESISISEQPLAYFNDFRIIASNTEGKSSVFALPDLATCPDCVEDLFNPDSRFFRYPFTSCSVCGPRYSIMRSQPYDRATTSMAGFSLCLECAQDYKSIENRRFHAQTIACPQCGPQLTLLNEQAHVLANQEDALVKAVEQLRAGKIVALKGIGGFQLLTDAANQDAIELLRRRKHRPLKPFAIMAADLAAAQRLCSTSEREQAALLSAAAPIVLLKRNYTADEAICQAVAPANRLLGIMLPYSPLHYLIMRDFSAALVVTSGNRQDEPICVGDEQALTRLQGIADYFLTHDRPVLRPLDDSVAREINGRITLLRRARGYVPAPLTMPAALPDTLAVGGQMKNTVAVTSGRHIILSQHLGDLDTQAAQELYAETLKELPGFYRLSPGRIMHDLHKDYASSRIAASLSGTKQPVQHHYAHALACMAEHCLEPPCLAVVWDGTGLGDDNSLWGGEFLLIEDQGFKRYAHLRTFPLPGGSRAILEPRRAALGLLYSTYGNEAFHNKDRSFTDKELELLKMALQQQINCPQTSSAGRLFDVVASLLGLCRINGFEGQAAMMLERTALPNSDERSYPFNMSGNNPAIINWQPMIEGILAELPLISPGVIALKFHNTLAEIILKVAEKAAQHRVVLSGGCFQNALLVEKAAKKLTDAGFAVFCHEKIPPNDGGLAAGQAYAAKFLR